MGFDFASMRANFFDRDKVMKAVAAADRRALSKFGAYVRTRARSSIRTRKKASAPGQPPSSHKGWLKQHLYFAWDQATRSVVVGPAQLGRGTAPRALEFGGPSLSFRRLKVSGRAYTATRVVNIRPRPFMHPALAAELPKFAGLYRGTLGGGSLDGVKVA